MIQSRIPSPLPPFPLKVVLTKRPIQKWTRLITSSWFAAGAIYFWGAFIEDTKFYPDLCTPFYVEKDQQYQQQCLYLRRPNYGVRCPESTQMHSQCMKAMLPWTTIDYVITI